MPSLILRSAAERLGLSLQDVRDYRMFGVGGELRVEAAYVSEFMVGQAVRKNWRVLVACEQEIAGSAFILGEDFFHPVDIEFDLAHNAVRLYQPRECAGAKLAYWATGGAGEVDIEAIDDAHPQIILTLHINGQPVRALLDSGAGVSVLNKSDAARLGVTPETPGVVELGGGAGLGANTVDNWSAPFESVAIGDEIIRNTTLSFADLWTDSSYTMGESRIPRHPRLMLLGFHFLRAHRVLVAHSQRKIYSLTSAARCSRGPRRRRLRMRRAGKASPNREAAKTEPRREAVRSRRTKPGPSASGSLAALRAARH